MLNKSQKKGKRITIGIVGCFIMIFALLVTTYAKYLQSESVSSQTATIAKWGFTIEVETNLFSSNYDETGKPLKIVSEDTKLSVKSDNIVMAPGTYGEVVFTIYGTAEVDAIISWDDQSLANVSELCLAPDGNDPWHYYPITYWVDGYRFYRSDAESVFRKVSHAFKAGDTISKENPIKHVWVWKWDYEHLRYDGDEPLPPDAEDTKEYNIYDGILAELAQHKGDSNYKIEYGGNTFSAGGDNCNSVLDFSVSNVITCVIYQAN